MKATADRTPAPSPAVDWAAIRDVVAAALRDPAPFDGDRLDARDPATVAVVLPAFRALAYGYLGLRVEGTEHIAVDRPAIYASNHNGGIMGPDLFCTLAVLWERLGPSAPLHPLAHDLAMRRVVPLGRLLQRVGAMRAHPDNARRIVESGGCVLVYPGGELDAFRPFWMRDRVILGERLGFVRVAQASGAPIVPVVAHGAHRSAIILHEGAWLARALGLRRWSRIERFPIALALPWLIGAGPWVPYFPLPFPITLRFLAPIEVAPTDDPRAVQRELGRRMQNAMDEMARCAS